MSAMSTEQAVSTLTGQGAPFEIETKEIHGIPTRIWKTAPSDLRAVLIGSQRHGELPFLVYEQERLSFSDHLHKCATLARTLADLGVKQGDRVAIAMRNYPEWPVAFWAPIAIGAISVPVNAWLTAGEMMQCLRDSGAKILIADMERVDKLGTHLKELSLLGVIAVRTEEAAPADVMRWEDSLRGWRLAPEFPHRTIHPDDDATIFYTSGTTGGVKGVVGTHRNMCTTLHSIAFNQACQRLKRGDSAFPSQPTQQKVNLLSVPLFHATGTHTVMALSLHLGSRLVLMHRWDPERAMELIERERVTMFGGVPTMAWQVVESPSFGKFDLSSVERVSYGGAPAAPELEARLRTMLPRAVSSAGYGLTETSAVVSQNVGVDYQLKPGSSGVPIPVCDLRIVDEEGEAVPQGELGEVCVRGPNVAKGYWNNPDETRRAFRGGWLHTGDIGRLDEEGFLYILDRKKDMLIRGGENIYCIEVENALYSHPAVLDAAVVGIPHRTLGEEVGAVVHVKPGVSVDSDELKSHVAERLAAFKVPVSIQILDEPLPRNANGKVVKKELRARFA